MNFDFSDDQKMLAAQAHKLLEEVSTPDRLRQLIDNKTNYDEALWQKLAELGFLGAAIPEEFGGIGLSAMELAIVAEEIGRFNAAVPFTSSIVLAAKAIELAGSQAQKEMWLPRIASGEIIACFAAQEGAGSLSYAQTQCQFSEGLLHGEKTPVADADCAHLAVVTCLHNNKPALALLELKQEQGRIARSSLNSFDELRPFAALKFEQAKTELLPEGNAEETLRNVINYAAVITAFEQVGGAEACLYMARDYALERQIFSRQLASYQAIKHKLADIYVKLELARSNAMYAVWSLVNDNEASSNKAIAISRLSALDAFETAARENLQIHGGIGYTFEANCHFYYRRERLLTAQLAGRNYWSRSFIQATQLT